MSRKNPKTAETALAAVDAAEAKFKKALDDVRQGVVPQSAVDTARAAVIQARKAAVAFADQKRADERLRATLDNFGKDNDT